MESNQREMKSIFHSNNNSVCKFLLLFVVSSLNLIFQLAKGIRNLSNFRPIAMKEENPEFPAIVNGHLEGMSLWVFMR